ncbi:ATP-dependent nuclease [Glutamicibacter ardleyensis]|uniref:ATP-dependent nuclease n=1 Tax=Glutamicibacter ardleyensis TaxID=225894 RepID=UPI003F91A9D7
MKDTLRSIELINFKGFKRHKISLKESNIFVGANNAGKSTALAAIRLVSYMLPGARRINPKHTVVIDGIRELGWAVTATALENAAFSIDNLRYDFSIEETRIVLTTSSGVRIMIVWPENDFEEVNSGGTLVIKPGSKSAESSPRDIAINVIPEINVIPRLTPLDDQELLVSEDTFRKRIKSGRSSRYFRNALKRLGSREFDEFNEFIKTLTPEVSSLEISSTPNSKGTDLDLYYVEGETRREREIAWAGDGIQIWLQLMYHLWMGREKDLLVLDEPDVFLHPDLQRRIARIISAHSSQTVIATHSVEIIAEAAPGSVVWIDRNRRSAERSRGSGALEVAGRRLGSGFELGLGRALRSNVALFVEGQDSPILAHIARTLNLTAFASSDGYATVPMGGFTRNDLASSFGEVLKILGSSLNVFVILDSDLRARSILRATEDELTKNNNVRAFIWKRRELENYLLVPEAISIVSGISVAESYVLLHETIEELLPEAQTTYIAAALDDRNRPGSQTRGYSNNTLLTDAEAKFKELIANPQDRVGVIDAKNAISRMNKILQVRKRKTLNVDKLARSVPYEFVPSELNEVLSLINDTIVSK